MPDSTYVSQLPNVSEGFPLETWNAGHFAIYKKLFNTFCELIRADSKNTSSGSIVVDVTRLKKNIAAVVQNLDLLTSPAKNPDGTPIKDESGNPVPKKPIDRPEMKSAHAVNRLPDAPATDNTDLYILESKLQDTIATWACAGQTYKCTSYLHPDDVNRLREGITDLLEYVDLYLMNPEFSPQDLPEISSKTPVIKPTPNKPTEVA